AKSFKVHFDDARPRSFTLEYVHKSPRFGPAFSISWKAPVAALREEAVRTASQADAIVVFAGLSAWLEGEEMSLKVPGFDGGDRTDIALPKAQADLIAALQATGKPVIIVLQTGSAVSLGSLGEKAAGVIEAWYGGEAGGTAIAEVLSGTVNPSGRLPVTFYKSAADLPPFGDYGMAGRTYRYFPGAVEYAFGHGLSYTSYAYSGLKLARGATAGQPFEIRVRVRNTGKRAGDEVAQLYLSTDLTGAPIRSLKGFQRVHLKPGEARTLTFRLSPRDLALADDQGVMRIQPAGYRLWVGGGQPGTGAPGVSGKFTMAGSVALPR
ncbi:MAG: glycoside hydrolase family 3 C-terminal domain-containing protein, partial [Sphingomonas sp.]